jgi:hypothetical protein
MKIHLVLHQQNNILKNHQKLLNNNQHLPLRHHVQVQYLDQNLQHQDHQQQLVKNQRLVNHLTNNNNPDIQVFV